MTKEKEINVKHSRFSDAPFYRPGTLVVVGGAGGIGSWLTIFLSRLGCDIHLVDGDKVDEVNLAGQAYFTDSIGMDKVRALHEVVSAMSGSSMYTYNMFLDEKNIHHYTTDYVFSCFDNMKTRKLLFEEWKKRPSRKAFIDGRMLMEEGQVYVVVPGKEEEYEATLFDDDDVEEQPCSAKATSHSGALIASLMVSAFNNIVAKEINEDACRVIPFKVTYSLPLFIFDA